MYLYNYYQGRKYYKSFKAYSDGTSKSLTAIDRKCDLHRVNTCETNERHGMGRGKRQLNDFENLGSTG